MANLLGLKVVKLIALKKKPALSPRLNGASLLRHPSFPISGGE